MTATITAPAIDIKNNNHHCLIIIEFGVFIHSIPSVNTISGLLAFHICWVTLYGFQKKNIGINHQITAIIGEVTVFAPNEWIFFVAL